jgi:lysophospholipase L1-like esterase
MVRACHAPDHHSPALEATPRFTARPPDPKRPLSPFRRVIFGAIALSLSLLISFAILEFGLATFYSSNVAEIQRTVFDEELGWRLKPGQYWIKAPQAFIPHPVSINTLGLRHPNLQANQPLGSTRIIALGDSFTFGELVADRDLFSSLLQARLNSERSGATYQVINAGVPGYGNAQELLFIRRLAARGIVADIYLLNLFTNDLADNLRLNPTDLSQNPIQPGFTLTPDARLLLQHRPQSRLTRDSNLVPVRRRTGFKLLEIIKAHLDSLAQTKPSLMRIAHAAGFPITIPRVPGVINAWYNDDVLDPGIPLMKALIREIDATVKHLGGVLLVTLIPSPLQVYPETYDPIIRSSFPHSLPAQRFLADPHRAQRITRQICAESGIPFLDVYDAFVAHKDQSLYVPGDGHFSKAGHSVFAAALGNFVHAHARRE